MGFEQAPDHRVVRPDRREGEPDQCRVKPRRIERLKHPFVKLAVEAHPRRESNQGLRRFGVAIADRGCPQPIHERFAVLDRVAHSERLDERAKAGGDLYGRGKTDDCRERRRQWGQAKHLRVGLDLERDELGRVGPDQRQMWYTERVLVRREESVKAEEEAGWPATRAWARMAQFEASCANIMVERALHPKEALCVELAATTWALTEGHSSR